MGEGTLQTGRVGRQVRQGQFNPIGTLQAGRVKPNTDSFAPESVFFEYWEAEDLGLADGAAVDNWPGRNGNASLTQPGASNLRPTFRESGGGALVPAVGLDGVDDFLIADSIASLFEKSTGLPGAPDGVLFMVFSGPTAVVNDWFWSAGSSISNTPLWASANNDKPAILVRGDSGSAFLSSSTTSARADDDAVLFNSDGIELDMHLGNSVPDRTVALNIFTTDLTIDLFTIGALRRIGVANWSEMDIHAVGVNDSGLAEADVAALFTYNAGKWGY